MVILSSCQGNGPLGPQGRAPGRTAVSSGSARLQGNEQPYAGKDWPPSRSTAHNAKLILCRPRRRQLEPRAGARTNIQGVFHAGDVQDRIYRQPITASGAGCLAAIAVERFPGMIVVADSGPLRYLVLIGAIFVLPLLCSACSYRKRLPLNCNIEETPPAVGALTLPTYWRRLPKKPSHKTLPLSKKKYPPITQPLTPAQTPPKQPLPPPRC